MGKSGGRRKKGGSNANNQGGAAENSGSTAAAAATANGGAELLDSSIFLKKANELKEEGNKRFQNKDYAGALEQYESALRLTPKTHPDRAVFHSNRAACLMQMKPIDYEAVIAECTMALQVQPRFVRALLRRARAFEAVGKYEMAVQDVQFLLAADPSNRDALEIAQRLRTALGPRQEAQQDLHTVGSGVLPNNNKIDKSQPVLPTENGPDAKSQLPKVLSEVAIRWRPLKLVYDHDIRLAQMPVNCSFRVLRDTVSKRFPSSSSVLIKFQDSDGDLVTITCTDELRLAESGIKGDESGSHSSLGDTECKEVEMDDWLFEFAQLFRSHVGIDPDAHIDLHELGMELCSEALEETVTSEEAQDLFDKAASKFQEVAALAFFNWGNVHMCAARKRIPLDESAGKDVVAEQLQVAYDWVKDKYSLAREKYEEALSIKPDFYEGLLALGQQQFEMAKLHWSFALAKKIDLSGWDSKETLQLFDSAEEKMKAATDMWEKLEEQRAKELKDPNATKKEELLRRRKKQGSATEEEAAEQAAVMRSQIHLFWGNMLFERSQVECKLGMSGWKENLDAATERFKLAGASEADISMVLKNHCSNGDDKKIENAQHNKTVKPEINKANQV
uniref:Tetratricopeptide repeat protein 1 n=1 Tax=Cajanus cajan TaxID=3821 RepID=A0A151SU13_CAJCA|nr:Tetratricopeptide repeat protein 1 [Cajanus cajan]